MSKGEIINLFNHEKVIDSVSVLIETKRGLKKITLNVGDHAQIVNLSKSG